MAVTTLTIVALAAVAASAGVGAYSAVSAGQAAKATGKYNAAVARNNQLQARQAAQFQADRQRKRNLILQGRQRAAFTKSGVDISQDVINDSAIEGELDIMATLYAGATQAQAYASRGRLAQMEGANAARAGYFGAASSVLGGVGRGAAVYAAGRSPDPYFDV